MSNVDPPNFSEDWEHNTIEQMLSDSDGWKKKPALRLWIPLAFGALLVIAFAMRGLFGDKTKNTVQKRAEFMSSQGTSVADNKSAEKEKSPAYVERVSGENYKYYGERVYWLDAKRENIYYSSNLKKGVKLSEIKEMVEEHAGIDHFGE